MLSWDKVLHKYLSLSSLLLTPASSTATGVWGGTPCRMKKNHSFHSTWWGRIIFNVVKQSHSVWWRRVTFKVWWSKAAVRHMNFFIVKYHCYIHTNTKAEGTVSFAKHKFTVVKQPYSMWWRRITLNIVNKNHTQCGEKGILSMLKKNDTQWA